MPSLTGPIYEINLDPPVALCRVWSSSDVDAETGARCAGEMCDALSEHVFATAGFQGVVFDVREGPPAFGPKTQATLKEMIAKCVRAGRRLAFLVGGSAIQQLQFRRLQGESGTLLCDVFFDESEARSFVADTT